MRWQEDRPVPGHEAFGRSDPVAVHSQAAFLLLLARGRRGRSRASPDQVLRDQGGTDDILADDPEAERLLDVPDWNDAKDADLAGARMQRLRERRARDSAVVQAAGTDAVAGTAKALYDSPGVDAALGLIEACLDAPHPLVRVAAAAADLRLDFQVQDLATDRMSLPASLMFARDPLVRAAAAGASARADHPDHLFAPARLPLPGHATEVLMRGAGDQDELVRDVAVSALEGARFHFENRTRLGPGREEPPDDPDRTRTWSPFVPDDRRNRRFSIVVHGTFARGWWMPGRAFPKYLRSQVSPNLYAGRRPFQWSGIYSHYARELGAGDLAAWAETHGPLDHVFAHSHGGNVAMMASHNGANMKKLVLLSCPVHARYVPAFDRIGKVVSVRTRLDLVILADGGRQRFRDARIREHVLPLWFSHKATRQPGVWRRHRIAAMI